MEPERILSAAIAVCTREKGTWTEEPRGGSKTLTSPPGRASAVLCERRWSWSLGAGVHSLVSPNHWAAIAWPTPPDVVRSRRRRAQARSQEGDVTKSIAVTGTRRSNSY
jgi:hypothetical protein